MPPKGENVVRAVYGGILSGQGRGFYVGLELMVLLRGSLLHADELLPSPTDEPITVKLRSHDFIRRLMGEPRYLAEGETDGIEGAMALEALAALGRGLRLPVPGRRHRKPWFNEHLRPYVGELIHYDAVFRKRKNGPFEVDGKHSVVSTERYLLRGAGGLAHMMLRSDHDVARLTRMRSALRDLVDDARSPLGELFDALARRDKGTESDDGYKTFEDGSEHLCRGYQEDARWVEILREGTLRIAERRELPRAKRAEALMHWVPYCIARYQIEVSCSATAQPEPYIPIDMGMGPGPIRRHSREVHDRSRSAIVAALEAEAERSAPELSKRKTTSWRDGARNFYSGSLAAVGALNATTGKRHFVMGNELLETIVLAMVDGEIPFDTFCRNVLFERLGLVVDKRSSRGCEQLSRLNRSDFEQNANRLASCMDLLGLSMRYSDTTRMVCSGGVL